MLINSVLISTVPIVLALATPAHAQTHGDDTARSRTIRQSGAPSGAPSSAVSDSLFRRAERLVREGRGEAGRALVDTLLAATRRGTAQHAQALYWRASLAGDAAEAERGYRHVIVEYPATRWAGDALLNLAQLEMARGDQEQALVHLHRFEREYPAHESRARASFWLARLYFDRKHEARGCASLATARVAASPEDVELRNQIDYYGQRCIGVDTAVATAPARPVAATPAHTAPVPTTPAPASPPANTPATAPTPRPAPSAPRDTLRDTTRAVPSDTPAPDSAARSEASAGRYTVQVAAYDSREAAEELIDRLNARGYTARLATTARPFRVRIGRYDTRADALAALQRLKAKGIEGFVTETEKP
ncbi:MAG: SPOR domain-containing protein [Gemmatimonadaceae bacterium]